MTQPKTLVLNLNKLIGLLSLTVQAILPAGIQFRYLQQDQILALQKKGSYSGHVTLENLAREELLWWMENLKLVEMVKGEEEHFHINVLELLVLKFAAHTFHKEVVTLDHSCSSGQQSCSGVSLEDGWYPQSTAFKNQQVNLELSAISSDHNYCRIPFKQAECQSTLGV